MFALMDNFRRAEGNILESLGFGPAECAFRVRAATPRWRLREYVGGNEGPAILIVTAPIKRPYIWDLASSVSAVRRCLNNHLRVFLLEWASQPSDDWNGGLTEYAGQSISDCISLISSEEPGFKPFLFGHSLGGTLAAIHGALGPKSLRGLVLLGAPLCFGPGSSSFRDALVKITPPALPEMDVVPGSLLSQISAIASPQAFIWSRLADAAISMFDAPSMDIHARVERWALDEVPLPGRLVHEIAEWLYREDQFFQGTLMVGDQAVGPSRLTVPTLAVVNTADEIVPPAAIKPFLDAMPGNDVRLIEYPGEIGAALQHLALLAGREAHTTVWPEIITWIRARS